MLSFELGADLFPGIVGRHALSLEGQSASADFGDQVSFSRYQ
jgi:hypothetical protein